MIDAAMRRRSDTAKRLDVLVVAGEESSDRIAAGAVRKLLKKKPTLNVHALGGPELKAAGARLRYPLAGGGIVGFSELAGKLSFFLKARKLCFEILERETPRVLVVVDAPDFNLPLVKRAWALGIPALYFVSPQVWAWRRSRVETLKRCCRKVLCIFPFEPPFLKKYGVSARYVGNPLLDSIPPGKGKSGRPSAPKEIRLGLLPGSRMSEVEKILPILADAARMISDELRAGGRTLEVTVFQGSHVPPALLKAALASRNLRGNVRKGSDLGARALMDLSLVTSGTATLETALLGAPMIVVYKVRALTGLLAALLVRVPHVAMPNLILRRRAFPEYIQGGARSPAIAREALNLLGSDPALKAQRRAALEIRKKMRGPSASVEVAGEILAVLGGS